MFLLFDTESARGPSRSGWLGRCSLLTTTPALPLAHLVRRDVKFASDIVLLLFLF